MRSVNTISAMALMDTTRAIAAAATYSLDAPNRGQHRRDRHPKKWHRRSSTSISRRNLGWAEGNKPRIPQTATEAGAIHGCQVGTADIFVGSCLLVRKLAFVMKRIRFLFAAQICTEINFHAVPIIRDPAARTGHNSRALAPATAKLSPNPSHHGSQEGYPQEGCAQEG